MNKETPERVGTERRRVWCSEGTKGKKTGNIQGSNHKDSCISSKETF